MKKQLSLLLAFTCLLLNIQAVFTVCAAAAPAEYVYSKIIDDTDSSIVYSGNWDAETSRSECIGGTGHHNWQNTGEYFEYKFTGTGIAYYSPVQNDQTDSIEIKIDNRVMASVSSKTPDRQTGLTSRVLYEIHDLPYGEHTIRATSKTRGYFFLDQLEVFNDPAAVTDNTASGVLASADNVTNQTGRPDVIGGTASIFWEPGAYFEYSFYGTGIAYYSPVNTDQTSSILVEIDGKTEAVISSKGEKTFSDILYEKTDLSYGLHTIKLTQQKGDGWMFLDQFCVYNEAPVLISSFEQTESQTADFDLSVGFNQPIDRTSAENTANYAVNGCTVRSASLSSDRKTVTLSLLQTEAMVEYTIKMNNIKSAISSSVITEENGTKSFVYGGPGILSAEASGNTLTVVFTAAMNTEDLKDVQNYSIPGITITAADPSADGKSVRLAFYESGASLKKYVLTVSNIKTAASGTLIEAGRASVTFYYEGTDELARYYKLDETSGSTVHHTDGETETAAGEILGSPEFTQGKKGGALRMSSAGKTAIDIGKADFFDSEGFTLSAWIKPDKTNQNPGVILSREGAGTAGNWRIFLNIGNASDPKKIVNYTSLNIDGVNVGASAKTAYSFGEWAHLAVTKRTDANSGKKIMALYLNGSLLMAYAVDQTKDMDNSVLIGARRNANGGLQDFYNGEIDEVKIYQRGMTDEEIIDLYRPDSGKNFNVSAENGRITVVFDQALQEDPVLGDFRIFFKRHEDMRLAMSKPDTAEARKEVTPTAVTAYSYDAASKTAVFDFVPIADAAVRQTVPIRVAYKSLYINAPEPIVIPAGNVPAPSATKPVITGEAIARGVLNPEYTYTDPKGRKEHESKYEWYVSDSAEGTFEKIPGVYTRTLFLEANKYIGKYIKVKVTPQNVDFGLGAAVQSDPIGPVRDVDPDNKNPRTNFMAGNFGMSSHILPNYQNLSSISVPLNERWNRAQMPLEEFYADFDVEAYADSVEKMGAKFVTITMDQHSGYNLAPNPYLDAAVGAEKYEKSLERDLFGEILDALDRRGIKTIMYLMGYPPAKSSMDAFDDDNPHSHDAWGDFAYIMNMGLYPYQIYSTTDNSNKLIGPEPWEAGRKYQQAIRWWGEKYGKKLAGFWFDGSWAISGEADNPWNEYDLIDAARTGNPDRIVSGAGLHVRRDLTDFHQGEARGYNVFPDGSRWESREQWDVNYDYMQFYNWEVLGAGWGEPSRPKTANRIPVERVSNYMQKVLSMQGSLCLEVRANRFGEIDSENYLDLKYINEQLNGAEATPVHSGKKALLIRDRTSQYSAPELDITQIITDGGAGKYDMSAWYRGTTSAKTNPEMNKVNFTVIWNDGGETKYLVSDPVVRSADSWTCAESVIDLSQFDPASDTVKLKLADTCEGLDFYGRLVPGRPMYIDDVSIKRSGSDTELMTNGGFEDGTDALPQSSEYLLSTLSGEYAGNISYYDPETELLIEYPTIEKNSDQTATIKAKIRVTDQNLAPSVIISSGDTIVTAEQNGEYYTAENIPYSEKPFRVFFWRMHDVKPLADAVTLNTR